MTNSFFGSNGDNRFGVGVWSLESATVQTPNFIRLTLFSQSELDTPLARPVRAELVDQTGQIVQTVTSPLAQGQRGFPLRTQIAFWLPPDFPTGRYGVRLNVLGEGTRPLDTLEITSVEVRHE